MKLTPRQADLLLVLVTAVWGSTFLIVKDAVSIIPPFAFLAMRFAIAFVVMAVLYPRRLLKADRGTWVAGGVIGLFLAAGYAFQTLGLQHTTASKAGFITGLSVVIVPVFSTILLRRPPGAQAVAGVVLATAGLGLLSLGPGLSLEPGDALVLACAIGFALHITATGRYVAGRDAIALTTIQIGCAALIYALCTAVSEPWPGTLVWQVWPALLITAVLATALAFAAQTVAQSFTSPTHTALIFSLEPVWAAVFGFLLAGEVLSMRGYAGASLILLGMFLAELPLPVRRTST